MVLTSILFFRLFLVCESTEMFDPLVYQFVGDSSRLLKRLSFNLAFVFCWLLFLWTNLLVI